MKTFAFIFARGGSKGLQNKNLKILGGIPLVGHSIEIAKKIKSIDKIFVSSDSSEIKKVAKNYKAQVIDRPPELSTDLSPEWSAWRHAIEILEEKGEFFDFFLSLPATAPLRSQQDILNCFKLMSEGADIVITASEASRNPYFNMIYREKDGTSRLVLENKNFTRRQDVPALYDLTTVAYLTTPSYIKSNSGIFDGNVKSVIIPKKRAVDIDDEVDFLLTQAIYEN
jgi:N-acylneuraminate cytidylyltransferase